jgi:hypothetical protein
MAHNVRPALYKDHLERQRKASCVKARVQRIVRPHRAVTRKSLNGTNFSMV